jgi:hypothetical protein
MEATKVSGNGFTSMEHSIMAPERATGPKWSRAWNSKKGSSFVRRKIDMVFSAIDNL